MICPLNRMLNGVFDLAMRPFAGESAWPGLIFASLLTSVVLVGLFAITSNPAGILRARNRLLARTLELLLFQHDLRVSLAACGRLLWANAIYLFQLLWPMAVSLVPLVLIFVQMEAWFDLRPLALGETAVVTVTVDPRQAVMSTPLELRVPALAELSAPAVRAPARNEVAWRIVTKSSGAEPVQVVVGDQQESKSLIVGTNLARVSPARKSTGILTELLSPSEPPLASSSPVRRIDVAYPARELTIGLTEIHWILAALALMMIFSLILGGLFGVRIA